MKVAGILQISSLYVMFSKASMASELSQFMRLKVNILQFISNKGKRETFHCFTQQHLSLRLPLSTSIIATPFINMLYTIMF